MMAIWENSIAALAARDWQEWAIFWLLTMISLIAVEVHFSRHGPRSRLFYKRMFNPFHWALGAVVFFSCAMVAYDLKGQTGQALWITIAFLGFFAKVSLLDALHDKIWSWNLAFREKQEIR